jgi:hypothetical protein
VYIKSRISVGYVYLMWSGTHKVHIRYTQGIHKVYTRWKSFPARFKPLTGFSAFGTRGRGDDGEKMRRGDYPLPSALADGEKLKKEM